MRRSTMIPLITALALGLAGCGDDTTGEGADPFAEAPTTTTDSTPATDPVADETTTTEAEMPETPDIPDLGEVTEEHREAARALLGLPESELPGEVRIVRRGEESLPVTMDLRVGRLNVELDDGGDGYRVTLVRIESPDGAEIIR